MLTPLWESHFFQLISEQQLTHFWERGTSMQRCSVGIKKLLGSWQAR